jgi:hypothetical protein
MEEITRSEHRAIVFKMNRKEAAAVARYIKDHSGSPETIFAVDVDTMELIIQAKNAPEEDVLVLEGEEDVFEVEEEMIEENEEVWEAVEEAIENFADSVEDKIEALVDKVEDALDGDK